MALCAVTVPTFAQSSSACKTTVSNLKYKVSAANYALRIATNQANNYQNRIDSLTQQSYTAIANLQAKEAAANTDFIAISASCYASVLLGGQYCAPSGRSCVSTTEECASILAATATLKIRAQVARQTAQKNWDARIAAVQTNFNRVNSKIPSLTTAADTAQNLYAAASVQCDATLALIACKTGALHVCKQDIQACIPVRSSCYSDVTTNCNLQPKTAQNQCKLAGRATCLDSWKTCAAKDCIAYEGQQCS